MPPPVDLQQLAVTRDVPAPPERRRRQLLARVVLPALLLAGFAALLAWSARDAFSSARPVTVVPVLTARGPLAQPADTPLFRAAGWVEPRPTPALVTALAEGVVARLDVVEGQEVRKGDVVATLVRADADLGVIAAEADVQLQQAELAGARAAVAAAKANYDAPLALRAARADAQAALARAEAARDALPAQLKAARSRQHAAKRDLDYRESATSTSDAALRKARADLEAADAAVAEAQARQKRLPAEVTALKDKRDALTLRLSTRVEERRELAQAEARESAARARLAQAEAARAAARLRLARMTVRAPASGRVLALVARPGMRLSGLAPGSLHDSSTVLTLYDPARLQVRVDVRLDDVAKVRPGQKARVESAALPGAALDGEVLIATSQADIQKNTLSVKVAVAAPPPALRPDMLCQVTFLAPPAAPGGGPSAPRLLVPRALVEASGSEGRVWVADRVSGTARQAAVRLGGTIGELVEVLWGLSSSDKVIASGREGLREGDRVRITGEDESYGRDGGGAR